MFKWRFFIQSVGVQKPQWLQVLWGGSSFWFLPDWFRVCWSILLHSQKRLEIVADKAYRYHSAWQLLPADNHWWQTFIQVCFELWRAQESWILVSGFLLPLVSTNSTTLPPPQLSAIFDSFVRAALLECNSISALNWGRLDGEANQRTKPLRTRSHAHHFKPHHIVVVQNYSNRDARKNFAEWIICNSWMELSFVWNFKSTSPRRSDNGGWAPYIDDKM